MTRKHRPDVHDMAPGAQLYLLCGGQYDTFQAAVAYVIAHGIPIFNASVGWQTSSRGDGSGAADTPDFAVKAARQAGVLPVISAGNWGERHWMGSFSSPDSDQYNDFTPGDETINVAIPAGERLCIDLMWDDWATPDQNYDLYLFNPAATGYVERSIALQNGGVGQRPVERLCYTNSGTVAETYHIIIWNQAATEAPRFDLYIRRQSWPDRLDEHMVRSSSLLQPGSSPSALSVAAICWSNNVLEPYSSRGPSIDGRVEPDIAGQSQVTVSSHTYGPHSGCGYDGKTGFDGTSAAAPHVAGAAALVKQAVPTATADGIQAFLEGAAADLGAGGRDNEFGSGKLTLPAASVADTTAPTDPVLSSPSHTVGVASRRRVVQIRWSGASDDRSGVDGFSYQLDGQPTSLPDATKDAEENIVGVDYSGVQNGRYYFHLRTRDNAGNWTSTRHLGPFVIAVPRVTGGGARCVVPNVRGKTVRQARRMLAGRRCALGRVTRSYSARVRRGRIIRQSRRPRARLSRGARVNVVVSRGRRR